MTLDDRIGVEDLIKRYCIAVDNADRAELETVFHPDALFLFGDTKTPIALYIDTVMAIKAAVPVTQHCLSTCLVKMNGDHATAESYFTAYHDVAPGLAAPAPFNALGERMDAIVAGRYEDRLVCAAHGWQIVERRTTILWQRWTPPAPHPQGW